MNKKILSAEEIIQAEETKAKELERYEMIKEAYAPSKREGWMVVLTAGERRFLTEIIGKANGG